MKLEFLVSGDGRSHARQATVAAAR
jgi:hypothetical protein